MATYKNEKSGNSISSFIVVFSVIFISACSSEEESKEYTELYDICKTFVQASPSQLPGTASNRYCECVAEEGVKLNKKLYEDPGRQWRDGPLSVADVQWWAMLPDCGPKN